MILEARCQTCHEVFNPHTVAELEHYAREDGTECGGDGELLGTWCSPDELDRVRRLFEGIPDTGRDNVSKETNEETTEDAPAEPTDATPEEPEELTLADQHRKFKEHAVAVVHRYGDDRNHCAEYDEILVRAGLPGRPVYYAERYNRRPPELVGEDTVEEFDAWRFTVARSLHDAARRYDVRPVNYDPVMREAGLPVHGEVYRVVDATLTGTFRIPTRVTVPVGDDLIDHVPAHRARELVLDHFHTSAVTWKITVPDEDEPTEDAQR